MKTRRETEDCSQRNIDGSLPFLEVHELWIEDCHFFVRDHEFFLSTDVDFLDYHSTLVPISVEDQLIPKSYKKPNAIFFEHKSSNLFLLFTFSSNAMNVLFMFNFHSFHLIL